MAYVMVDVEADGPIPGEYSMVCFGAVLVEPGLGRTFCGELRPISDKWIPEALKVSGSGRCSFRTTTASTGSSSTGTFIAFSHTTRSDSARRIWDLCTRV